MSDESSYSRYDLEKGLGSELAISVTSQGEESEKTTASRPPQLDGDAQDPNLVTWDGPDDPENPFNWKPYKKARQLVFMAFNTFLTYAALGLIWPRTSRNRFKLTDTDN